MLDRKHRFHGLNALTYVYRQGQSVRSPQLLLKYARNSRRQQYRAAVVVSRKVDKSAVTRNRIRRRLYEAIRLQSDHIEQPYDLVFTVISPTLAELDSVKLQQLVRGHLRKAGVWGPVKPARRAIVNPEE